LAFQLYDQAIQLGDRGFLSQAYYNKGVLAFENDSLHEALDCFQKAIAVDPDYEKAWVNLGNIFLRFERHQEALDAFRNAQAILPDQVTSLFNTAMTLNRLNKFDDAWKILSSLVARDEKTQEVRSALDEKAYLLYSEAGLACLQLNNSKQALHFFSRAFNLNSSDYQIVYNIAFIYDRLKDYDQALLFYDLSIALDEFKGYQGKACTYIHLKKFEDALELISKAINIAPDNFEGYYNLACIYSGLNQKANLINAVRRVYELAPAGIPLANIFRSDPDFSAYHYDADFVAALREN
jgi:tetratricopeptide (TPR) repeat protein